jgi:hypothetical protein
MSGFSSPPPLRVILGRAIYARHGVLIFHGNVTVTARQHHLPEVYHHWVNVAGQWHGTLTIDR